MTGKQIHLATRFGQELRRYRDLKGWTRGDLAEATHYSFHTVKSIELACRPSPEDFVQICDELLDTRGALPALWELLHGEVLQPWFQNFVAHERVATQIRNFEPIVVPGLLQTLDYARDLIRKGRPTDGDKRVEDLAQARVARQDILDRDEPPLLWAVLGEAALRCPVGGPAVHRAQLQHLLAMSKRPHVVMQVLPESVGAHACMLGPLAILGFVDEPDMVWQEGYDGGHFIVQNGQISACNVAYNLIRADALSTYASARFIAAMLERDDAFDPLLAKEQPQQPERRLR